MVSVADPDPVESGPFLPRIRSNFSDPDPVKSRPDPQHWY